MILLKKDFSKGRVSLKISAIEDLWYLSHIISPGDMLISRTQRKIKLGDSESSTKVIKKTITLTIKAEDVVLQEDMSSLRVKGIVDQGPEDVPKGSYHTFGFSQNDAFTLIKPQWLSFQKEQLHEAISAKKDCVLFCLFDREKALFSLLRQTGITHVGELSLDVPKKQYVESASSKKLFSSLLEELSQLDKHYGPKTIVCASPAFWQTYISKDLCFELKKKVLFVTSGDVSRSAINSLLSRPELANVLADQRVQQEQKLLHTVLHHLQKNTLQYGLEDVFDASKMGAVDHLVVSANFIKKTREENRYEQLDALMKIVDKHKGEIHIVQDCAVTKTIDGLGGVVATTRWVVL
ncbi:MAG: hypothetical protein ACOCQQ_00035 [Candidatus Nanoarchaeia archaeon]